MKVQKFHVSADFNKVSINESITNKLTLSEDLDDNIFSVMDAIIGAVIYGIVDYFLPGEQKM